MALVLADRVKDTTTTTGTGAVTLSGSPPAGFQSFGAAIGNGNTTYYTISGDSQWEVGIGTYNSTGTTLSRDVILSSSNGGSAVNFSAGTKDVFVTYPAEKSVNKDAAGNINISITGNAATATVATNLYDGAAGSIPYQTAANTTAFVAAASGVLVGGSTPAFSTTPTLTGTNFTGIPNAALTNSAITIGTTAVSLGATSLTLGGLTSVTVTQDPVSALQLATKQYVDTQSSSAIHYHQPVRVESPTNLNATYDNGTAGVGATLTNAGAQTALVLDGVTLSVNDRVLIYQQTTQTQNGIYVVTNVGSGSTNWVLTRSSDANTYVNASPTGLSEGSTVFVQEGATGAGETYTCTTQGTITFGTTAIVFAQISSAQIYSAGTGLTLTGTQFSLTAPVATTLGGTGLTTFTAANRALYSTGATTLTAGTLPVAAGGTGQTSYTDGQILIGRTSDGELVKGTITAGTAISVSNGAGSISITNTAPDQVVSLTAGGTTSITGSYPNFNISSADQYVGTVTSVSGTGTVNGLTLTGTVTSTGSLTLGGTLSVNLATDVTGTLPVANGGTGVTSSTGSGSVVLSTSPSLVTPSLGVATATSINKLQIIAPATSATLAVANGKDFVVSNSLTLAGTDFTTMTFPAANATIAGLGIAQTFTNTQTLTGSTSVLAAALTNAAEVCTVSATAATGTINYDVSTQSVLYYTTNASANWTVNFRHSSGTSLNTAMSIGQVVTVTFLVTQGGTAYYNSAVQVDGSSVTPKWQGGSAPTTGNTSSVDIYTYAIVKTGNAAFTVFASQTQFK